MTEELLPFEMEEKEPSIIKVIGVGGGGSNAVKNMHKKGIEGVDFIICNTDKQALNSSLIEKKVQLGPTLTEGLGAGCIPEKGRQAAIESIDEFKKILDDNSKMVFITAGMGGGTGTGAAPIIAEVASELEKLTVGIVTIPFRYEGKQRIKQAVEGIREMNKHVDALLVENNEKIREIHGNLAAEDAFEKADDVLTVAAKGIAEIITKEGKINVDFADVQTVMKKSGIALMGTGSAKGENRALTAVENALSSPLLDNNDINGARNLLISIAYSESHKATMDEIVEINEVVQDAAGNESDLTFGYTQQEDLAEYISVTIIATGFGEHNIPALYTNIPDDFLSTDDEEKKKDNEKEQSKENFKIVEDFVVDPPIVEDDEYKDNDPYYINDDLSNEPFQNNDRIFNEAVPVTSENKKKQPVNRQTAAESESVTRTGETHLVNYLDNLEELEREPAYKRQRLDLGMKKNYSNDQYSRFTLGKKGGMTRRNNQYLHDNSD